MEENNNQNSEVELVKGEEVKQAVKKRANQTLRIGLIWFLAGLLITAISWIMADAGGSYTLMWGLSIYGIFILFKGFDLSQKADQLSKDGIPQEELDSLVISKTNKILTKVFVAIGVVGVVISGAIILLFFVGAPKVIEDYGTVISDNTGTTGWLTYVAEEENIQVDFTAKPITYSFEGYYEDGKTTDMKFFSDDNELGAHQYNLFVESNYDVYTSEKIITNLREHLARYEIDIPVEISIMAESEEEIIYEYPIEDLGMILREKLIYTEDNVYGLSYIAKEDIFDEEKWNHFVNSFTLQNSL